MCRKRGLNLVAVLVETRDETLPLAITHVYHFAAAEGTRGTVHQRSFRFDDSDGYETVCRRADDLWAGATRRIWDATYRDGADHYIELKGGLTPQESGLPGKWECYAEL